MHKGVQPTRGDTIRCDRILGRPENLFSAGAGKRGGGENPLSAVGTIDMVRDVAFGMGL